MTEIIYCRIYWLLRLLSVRSMPHCLPMPFRPLLLELGVHPLISTATSSLMVLFSASSAMLSLAFNSALNVEFALIFGLSCLGASLLGVLGVSHLVRKSGKVRVCHESLPR